ncbi:MAG: HlyD family efflux transporter periplasmic adaptor subunit, partial [Candidatus Andersenbacteria bacterium]
DIVSEQVVEKSAVLEPGEGAPLIARAGGRITNLKHVLGQAVKPGELVAVVDGGNEGSPVRAQVSGTARSLALFNDIQTQATRSADIAVDLAQASLDAAQDNRTVTLEQQQLAQSQADLAVQQAEQGVLQVSDTRSQGVATNDLQTLITTAQLGVEAARLAEEQAVLAQRTALTQTTTGLEQAQLNLQNAQTARDRIGADLASQRNSLTTQVRVAQAQLQQMQVIAPVSGTIASLTVREGDYVQPGQRVGEIVGAGNGFIRTEVATHIRDSLTIGKQVTVLVGSRTYPAYVAQIGTAPSSSTALWQVDLVVEGTVAAQDINRTVTVQFTGNGTGTRNTLLPLDSVNVRQNGLVAFRVDQEGVVHEHLLSVIGYQGSFVEVENKFSPDDLVVVSGNRRLKDGDKVEVRV